LRHIKSAGPLVDRRTQKATRRSMFTPGSDLASDTDHRPLPVHDPRVRASLGKVSASIPNSSVPGGIQALPRWRGGLAPQRAEKNRTARTPLGRSGSVHRSFWSLRRWRF